MSRAKRVQSEHVNWLLNWN